MLEPDGRTSLARVLREGVRARALDVALRIGGEVLDRYFAGDLEDWRSGQFEFTLRRLARDPTVGVSPSTLYRYVAITALCRRMGRTRFHHLGTSHLRQVLPLPLMEQVALVTAAEEARWTVRELAARVRESTSGGPALTWREAVPHLRAWSSEPHRIAHVSGPRRLPAADARRLRLIRSVIRDLQELERALVEES